MGVDLTLGFPIGHRSPRSAGAAGTSPLISDRLDLPRNYEVWDAIHHLPTTRANTVHWYGDGGLEQRDRDPYGSPLCWVRAGDLATVDLNDAGANAVVAACHPDNLILLWWH